MTIRSAPAVLFFAAAALIAIPGCGSDDAAPTGKPAEKAATKPDDAGKKAADATKTDPKTETPSNGEPKKFTYKDKKMAKAQYALCTTCHGVDGKGEGAVGKTLNPKPRNWTDAKWQDATTDEQIFHVIKDGGAKHGLSAQMAPNMVQDNDAVIWALVDYVRSFKGE